MKAERNGDTVTVIMTQDQAAALIRGSGRDSDSLRQALEVALQLTGPEHAARLAREDEFWKLTEPLGWGTKSTDYRVLGVQLLYQVGRDKLDELNQTYTVLRKRLDKAVGKHVDNLGDDGYNDLLAHIIGLGRMVYEHTIAHPELARQRAEEYDFTESFSYVFHGGE